MINWQSILSSFDDKPTLLEWLKKVQKALNESALTTVTVTQEKAGRVNSITLSFNFQDGTKIVAPAFTVNDGVDGVDGIGITDLINTSLTYDNLVVTYDTTDGLRVFATQNMSYHGGNHNSGLEFRLPIMPGNGIVIAKKANAEEVEVKIDTTVVKKIYKHQVKIRTSTNTGNLVFLSSSNVQITFDSLAGNTNGEWARFIFGTVSKSTGDYAVEKVHGWKDQHTTEVYLDPVVPSTSGSESVIFTNPTAFTDQVTEL